ncbi:MAG TPA: hypothetical protein VH184_19150, partial [Dongiaceae bacterium]|nr:hypothetical protein [Dongiaceae bacterium]
GLDQDIVDLLEIRRRRRPYEHVHGRSSPLSLLGPAPGPDSGLFRDAGDGTYARSPKLLIKLNFHQARQFFSAGGRAAKVA